MGEEFLKTKDIEDVKNILNDIIIKRRIETVSIKDAHRRILAEDVRATINFPPFDRASMDGYAVKAEDTFGASEDNPVVLKLLETIKAGSVPTKKVEEGVCVEVGTGAPIPEGANGVVMVEFTEKKGGDIYVYDGVVIGENIAKEGSDIKKGELILSKGTLLSPDKIGVLSAIGMGKVPVFAKPKVAVISTGNEIIKYDDELEYGKIYDINTQTIVNAVKSCGCTPIYSEIVKDSYEAVAGKINKFSDADVIITSGGTSAGAGDVLRMVLDDIGEVLVHGIAMKPGKPTIIGMINDKIVFGLPGYPVAALIVFHVFVAPFLRKMACLDDDRKVQIKELKLSKRYHSARGRNQYVLVKIDENMAHPILKDSGAIGALAEADGYFEVPKNVEIIQEGSYVDVVLLGEW